MAYGPKPRPVEERFREKVDTNGPVPAHDPSLGPCHLWTGATDRKGYGKIGMGSRRTGLQTVQAHRLAFFMEHGRWPEPEAMHRCDNPPCVKARADEHGPAHIIEGTRLDNARDSAAKGRNASQRHPERRPRGDAHFVRRNPDFIPRRHGRWAKSL